MRRKADIEKMLEKIESLVPADERGPAIMALEWVLNGSISTSLGLEDWAEEFAEG